MSNKINSNEVNQDIEKVIVSEIFPVLPLRGLTVFPNMLFHFDVGRKKSIKAIEAAMAGDGKIFLLGQKELRSEEPKASDLYSVGTVAKIRQILKISNESVRILVEGEYRAKTLEIKMDEPYLIAEIKPEISVPKKVTTKRDMALIRSVKETFSQFSAEQANVSDDVFIAALEDNDMGHLCDYICQNIHMQNENKQQILEILEPKKRAEALLEILSKELEILLLENKIQDRVRMSMDKHQREYYLREQIRIINDELGDGDDTAEESTRYALKIRSLGLSETVENKLLKEASRLGKMHSGSPEGGIIRTYLDTCIELPWNVKTAENTNIKKAKEILEHDHYGMQEVKERILELFAVRTMGGSEKGQIICLAGPPGVGKTSVAASVARACGRKFARLSLGGVRDEAEIRGHRKTYIGAMPGRIINAVKQAGSRNCVILIDEIDKIGNDYKGDPNAALLEVFDTEQNSEFRDHFIELPFDLSDVLFITTANDVGSIPRPLLDRMELIELHSYTDIEKAEIAKRHLVPKQLKKHGLTAAKLKIPQGVLAELINGYTRESGVRNLERTIAKLCRKAVKDMVETGKKSITISSAVLKEYLGSPKYRDDASDAAQECGVVNGLAYTSVGGEILLVEANVLEGSGKQETSGNLGDVMKESVRAAITYIRSRAEMLDLPKNFYSKNDMHLHFPEAAVPKDGPSAGIAITSAILSALLNKPVQKTYAMTGEITIRGRILAIGGLREKTMAAYRNGVKTIIVPKQNFSDVEELDPVIKENVEFVFVSHMDEVLGILFGIGIKQSQKQKIQTIIPIVKEQKGADIRQ